MKQLMQNSLAKSMNYAEYSSLTKQLVEEGKTTGEQTLEKIHFTKLNFSRMKRLNKTIEIPEEYIETLGNISEKQTWLVISEPWCGDAANTLPILNKIAQLSENIKLRIVLRDETPELMDQFLTNGSRSIPIIIMIDAHMNVISHWGPRSKAANQLVDDYKFHYGKIDETFKEMLQVWYNYDKGISVLEDILGLIEVKA